jgi:hypothetical protein
MHPIERLRYVARASGYDDRSMVTETAAALRGLGLDAAGMVAACRRIVERHPTCGPLWWLCARVLASPDPYLAARQAVTEIDNDATPEQLIDAVPADARVATIGWPDLAGEAIARRGDLSVLAIQAGQRTTGFVRHLRRVDVDVEEVPADGLGSAVSSSDLVLLEAAAVGPTGALMVAGSLAAASVAYCAEVPVWAVVGVGKRLPAALWTAMLAQWGEVDEPWQLDHELVPLTLISHLAGPAGITERPTDCGVAECPVAYELIPRARGVR